jgi:hypothetical protein
LVEKNGSKIRAASAANFPGLHLDVDRDVNELFVRACQAPAKTGAAHRGSAFKTTFRTIC